MCPACHEPAPEVENDFLLGNEIREAFLEYEGDDYLIRAFIDDGDSEEQARKEVQDPRFLRLCLEFGGLEYLLKDRWATRGLLDALHNHDRGVLESLVAYVSRRAPPPAARASKKRARGKPGPKPDSFTKKYLQERAVGLRAQGLSLSQISERLYEGDPGHANRVTALLSVYAKKLKQGRQ
jgi:hypothetical protein